MAEPRMAFRRSPLFHRQPLEGEGGAVRIAELPFGGKLVLRADPNEAVEPLRTRAWCGTAVRSADQRYRGRDERSFGWGRTNGCW